MNEMQKERPDFLSEAEERVSKRQRQGASDETFFGTLLIRANEVHIGPSDGRRALRELKKRIEAKEKSGGVPAALGA